MPWGKQARAPQLLKPKCPRACALQQEKPSQGAVCALQLESCPHVLQLEKVHGQQRGPSTAKNK